MTAPTHIAFAELFYLLILTTTGIALNIPNALFVAAASVLPDIDTGASFVGKVVPAVSLRIERKFGHRTLTHSFCCVAALALLLTPICAVSGDVYVCFLVGYLSHPLLDTGTMNGTKLFYPFSQLRCVFPLDVTTPRRYRVQTGSRVERFLGIFFLVCCVPTFYIASQGYERFIRVTQASIEAAVRDYEEFSAGNFVTADIDAHDMLTKQHFTGTFPIVGALNPHTLVFKSTDERLHTIGKSFEADYVAENIVCHKAEPSYAAVRTIDMSNKLLAQLTSEVDSTVQNFFFGNVATLDKVSLPENIKLFTPVTGSGGEIKLNFATLNDIREYNLEYVFVTKGLLTVKSISPLPAAQPGSTGSLLPKIETYAQLSYLITPKDSAEILMQRGDTIRQGDLIARKVSAEFFDEQIALNAQRLIVLENQMAATLEEYDRRIATARLNVLVDSTEYRRAQSLVSRKYLSAEQLTAAELKWQKSQDALLQSVSARQEFRQRNFLDLIRMRLVEAELRAKARSARLRSEIRSPYRGVLVEVRQLPQDNNTRLVFIIKRVF